MNAAGLVDIWVIFTFSWLFVIEHTALSWIEWRRYGAAPWWRTWFGWLFTMSVASLGTVCGFVAAARVWPWLAALPWYMWMDLVALSMVGAVTVGKVAARIWLHLRARRDDG